MTANTGLSVNNRLIKKFPLLDSIMNCRGHRYNQRSFKIHPCPLRRFFNVEINSILCSTSLNFFRLDSTLGSAYFFAHHKTLVIVLNFTMMILKMHVLQSLTTFYTYTHRIFKTVNNNQQKHSNH